MIKQRDVIIIGAGPAGAAAALHTANTGHNVIVLGLPNDPGYWAKVKSMNSFPGLPDNISGSDFIKNIKGKTEAAGAVFRDFEVISIKKTETNTYEVAGSNSESFETPVVIIASGISKAEHFLAGEKDLIGKGVYYSVKNDAPTLRHHSAVIIGKSEEAARATLYLSKYSEKIFFVIPSSKLDVSEELSKEIEANRKIEPLFSSSIKKLNGHDELHSITILNAGSEREIKTRAAFIYTYNLTPRSEFVKEFVEIDKGSGRILVNSEFATSRPGIFACGDVLAGELQHPTISAAQGIIAAINANKFLTG